MQNKVEKLDLLLTLVLKWYCMEYAYLQMYDDLIDRRVEEVKETLNEIYSV